jgi:phosphatidate cytidylyltransferase
MVAKGFEASHVLAPLSALALAATAVVDGLTSRAILTGVVLLIPAVEPFRRVHHRPLNRVAATLFGALYVGWLSGHLILLREIDGGAGRLGLLALGLLATATWACDILAYLVGVAFGRHKLAPRVSPKKTIEGAVGGVLGAVAASAAAVVLFADFLTLRQGLLLGLTCGVAGQAGDLFESLLKRDAGLKDTATLLPGHGGILDRFDSLLFNAPLVYWLLRSWGV